MFCPNCGKEIYDNSTVCQFCGAQQVQPQQTPYQAPQQGQYGAPQQAPYQAPQQGQYGAPQQAPYQATYQAPQQGQYNTSFAPPPAKKKSKAPLIIGIVVGVIVLIAIIGAIAGSGSSDTDSGYAPVETFGDYDFEIESIPDDAVAMADVHTLTKTEDGVTYTYVYYCDGDKVNHYDEKSSIDVSTLSQEEIDAIIADLDSSYQSTYSQYDFIEYKAEVIDNQLTESYTIKNVSDHITELKELGLLTNDSAITLYISYAETEKAHIANGFTVVE